MKVKEKWLGPYTSKKDALLTVKRMREIWGKTKGRFSADKDDAGEWRVYRTYTVPDPKPVKPAKYKPYRRPRLYTHCQQCRRELPRPVVWKDAFCDGECYVTHLERKSMFAKARRERAAYERTEEGQKWLKKLFGDRGK